MSDSKLDDLRLEFFAKKEAAADILLFASKFECEAHDALWLALEVLKTVVKFQETGQKVGALSQNSGVFTEFVGADKESFAKVRSNWKKD